MKVRVLLYLYANSDYHNWQSVSLTMDTKAAATELNPRRGVKGVLQTPQRIKMPDLQAVPMLTVFCCALLNHLKNEC